MPSHPRSNRLRSTLLGVAVSVASAALLPMAAAWAAQPFTLRDIRVEGVRPLPVHADGEPLGTTPVAFAVRPGALRIFAPVPHAS